MGEGIQKRQDTPKEAGKHTVISTFAGIGGSSLGYRMAGFRELLAIDFNDYCEKIFKLNFPGVPFWNRDITKISGKEILDFCKIGKDDLDILDGSPPCQGFSMAGNREISDSRNDLFMDFIRLVRELGPKVFIMENVAGQARGRMKGVFIEIMAAMRATGYSVKAKLMNAMYYGVPQSRERVFYVGVRPDVGEPEYPEPSRKMVSVREAFKDLKENDPAGTEPPPFMRPWLRLMAPGEGASRYHPKGNYFNHRRAYWGRPTSTVTKTRQAYHPFEDRFLSMVEVKRLCSFPDDFKLVNSLSKQWYGLGNAVMPLQMKAIAEAVRDKVLLPYYNKVGVKE